MKNRKTSPTPMVPGLKPSSYHIKLFEYPSVYKSTVEVR